MARHEFALFVPHDFEKGSTITIQDADTLRRLTSILRLKEGETLQLFNRHETIKGSIVTFGKKGVQLAVQERLRIQALKPTITVLLPLLKKDDYEEALSRLTALGVTKIQPVVTDKIQKTWDVVKEQARLERVMIAAAEQSKQLALPVLHAPCSLRDALKGITSPSHKLFFDPDGKPLLSVMTTVSQVVQECVLCVGPEGDLADEEKELLKTQGFVFCALTPSILRACEAVALGAGVLRSVYR